jgi:hypothetical protein
MRKYILLFAALAACGSATTPPAVVTLPPAAEVVIPGAPVTMPPPAVSTPVTSPPPPTGAYAADDDLRMNEVQLKGTHNSYHLASNAQNAPAWTQYSLPTLTDQLAAYGVRQFELDVHYYGGRFLVFHLPDLDERSSCPALSNCLQELLAWSYAHPLHQPIYVWLELKDEWDPEKIAPHIEELEAAVRAGVPREKLVTPDDVRCDAATLVAGLQAYGWPALGKARGKFVFVVMNEGDGRYAYTYGDTTLAGRAMFVTEQAGPNGAVAMIDDVLNQIDAIYAAASGGLLVRSRVDDLPGQGGSYAQQRDAALAAGAQMITTDYPVAGTLPGYAVEMPGGTPSRCDPVTARAFCQPRLIEDPNHLAR